MERRIARRRRGETPAVESLEGRALLSGSKLPPGYAAAIVSQSNRDARPAPQSPSPATTRVTVATDRPSYAPGDPVRLTLTQAVAGRSPVNTGPMGHYDVVVSRRGRDLWRLSEVRGPAVASHVLVTMRPGESRQATAIWDGRARDGSVVTGPVEIRAVIDRVESAPRVVQIGPDPRRERPAPASRPAGPAAVAASAQPARERQALHGAGPRPRAFAPPARPFGLGEITPRRPGRLG